MTKLKKDELRESFRGKLTISEVAKVKKDPNYDYKLVIYTYDHDPERVDRYLDNGWDVVYSEDKVEDNRSFVPDSSKKDKDDSRLKPVTKRLKGVGGHTAVLMKIKKSTRMANELKKAEVDKERQLLSTRKNKHKIRKEGNNVIVSGSEVDLSQPEQDIGE